MRNDFPKFSDVGTFADNFFLVLILTSIIPCFAPDHDEEETEDGETQTYNTTAIMRMSYWGFCGLVALVLVYKWISQRMLLY